MSAHVARAASVVAPRAISQPHTFSKSAILHSFPNFCTLRVDIFRIFFPFQVYVWPPWTMKSFMEIGPHVFRNPEHRHTDEQTRQLLNFFNVDTITRWLDGKSNNIVGICIFLVDVFFELIVFDKILNKYVRLRGRLYIHTCRGQILPTDASPLHWRRARLQ